MTSRKKQQLSSLLELRTSLGNHVRSLPTAQRQELMDAYMTLKRMQLLENQLIALNKRKRQAQQTLQRLLRRLGDTKLKDLIAEELAAFHGPGEATGPRESTQNRHKRSFATVKLNY